MLNQIKTILLVTTIALVVWLFAEAESVRTRELTLTLELPSDPTAGTIIQPADPAIWRERVQVTVSGSAAALAAFQASAAKPLRLTPDMDAMPSVPGEADLDFRAVLRQLPLFASRGVTISRADPAILRVWVDRIVQRPNLRIEPTGLTVEIEGAAVITPATVTITGPESVLAKLPPDAAALARPQPADQARLVPGRADKLQGVPLEVPREIVGMERFVRLAPARADLELTVRSRRTTSIVGSVPVQVMLPALLASQWDVAAEQPFFSDVQASGPSELIDQLKRGELRVYAVVALSADELDRAVPSKEAVFTTLPASTLTFKTDNPIVKLTIARRKEAPKDPAKPSPPSQ